MKKDWTDELRSKLDNHQIPPPPGLWERIEQAMEPPVAPMATPRPWWRYAGIAAALLGALYLGYLAWQVPSDQPPVIAEQAARQRPAPALATETDPAVEPTRPAPSAPASQRLLASARHQHHTAAIPSLEPSTDEPTEPTAQGYVLDGDGLEVKPIDPTVEVLNPSGIPADKPLATTLEQELERLGLQHLEPSAGTPASSSWSTGLYASSIAQAPHTSSQGEPAHTYAVPSNLTQLRVAEGDTRAVMFAQASTTRITYKHRQPLRLGAMVRYQLSPRWGIESGLVYSVLTSEITKRSGYMQSMSEQKLHYVGLPVGITYNIWRTRGLLVYTSAGAMVEKCVLGRVSSDHFLGRMHEADTHTTISVPQLQWSVNASLGLQYSILPNLGIYAEPKLNYYIKNSSPVETIYQEKPLGLNLQLGVRLTL